MSAADRPQGSSAVTGAVPVLSRTGHDRAHLSRSLHDPTGGRPVRVLVVDPHGAVPVDEGPDGPVLIWDDRLTLPTGAVYLGEADGVPYAAVHGERSLSVNGRAVAAWSGLRELGADLGDLDAGLLVEAIGILEWHARHRFSPLTGAPTTVERAGWVQRDPTTGAQFFPRTDPAVIMLVHDGADRCVLGRQPSWPVGRFSTLAGFVEPGESAEQAVVREVDEEAGIAVGDVAYVTSQPWPFPSSLMLAFTARAEPDAVPRTRDGELAEVRWFSRDEVLASSAWGGTGALQTPTSVSVAWHLIRGWAQRP